MNISQQKYLITGGAGFIGSNIVEYLLKNGAGQVRVLDNLSTGNIKNILPFMENPRFEFINGDITNYKTCLEAVRDIEYISHQAALGSVPRSLKDPILSNNANVLGFLNMLTAAKDSPTCKSFVYASSSSVYGDSKSLPKREGEEGNVLSPYALTKMINENYSEIFSKCYGFKSVGLRYFNVFGPNQNPEGDYAAVIPKFIKTMLIGNSPIINGDGNISRDFTFVDNVVQANIKCLLKENTGLSNSSIYNVACGDRITLFQLVESINEILGLNIKPILGPFRKGDINHSHADISNIIQDFEYSPSISFKKGIEATIEWYRNQ